ncbi:tetratricopeptide repeat protein [Aquimarina pacifica]|uniref:tetratricopeptide repeat protein n=1 Tax=Aquimarina pacifica TaxID=1296415 RepID=UPI00047117B7|nr:tetratricopeptide repeat protein [Aquimarina pacifica]
MCTLNILNASTLKFNTKKIEWIICISLLFFVNFSYAIINKEIDSLKKQLALHNTNDILKVDLFNEIGYEYWIINPNESIFYGKKALALSKKLTYQEGVAYANRVIGVAFWAQGYQNKALEYLITSQNTYEKIKNTEGIANTTLNIGMVYADLEQYDKSLSHYNKAIDKFMLLELKDRIATTFTKMATIFIAQNRIEEAKKYLNNALEIHTKNSFIYGIAEVHNRLGLLYIKENQRAQAYYHVHRSMSLGQQILDIDGLTSNYILLGKIHRLDNELDLSEKNLNKGLKKAKENNLKKQKLAAYEELKELRKQQNRPIEALAFSDRYIQLKDSILDIEKSKQIAYLEFENQLQKKDKEVQLLRAKEKVDILIRYALIAGILIVCFVIYLALKSSKKNKKLLERDQELSATNSALAQQALENSKLQQIELQRQLDFKNKELTSYALNFVQKNEMLQQLLDKLIFIKNTDIDKRNPIIVETVEIIKRNLTTDKDWEDFKMVFEKVHIEFYPKLTAKHPDLKTNDLKICSLIRLNLNIKETASILGISPESVKTARYRLRKKLGLQPKQEIVTYLIDIEKS